MLKRVRPPHALRRRPFAGPPWRQPRGKWMISLVNSHTNATLKRWHMWEIDLGFALNSTLGWRERFGCAPARSRPPAARSPLTALGRFTYPQPHTLHLHPTSHTLHPTPCILHPTTYTLHPSPYILHLTPYTLHPAPYTLHLTPFTLHPTPYTLHPTPYTLRPTPWNRSS